MIRYIQFTTSPLWQGFRTDLTIWLTRGREFQYRAGMGSRALHNWQGARAVGLDNLETIHASVTKGRRGRQRLTIELNHALIARLASEFQGYCRDLHDEAIAAFVTQDSVPDKAFRQVFQNLLEDRRDLDTKNATPGSLGSDFFRLGIAFWPDIRTAYPAQGASWNARLEALNYARNAIAHNDARKLAIAASAQPLTLSSYRKWRRTLNSLARGLDGVVGSYLKLITGSQPW